MYRWHKAAFDGAKQVAKLQAEAKAAIAQSDSATAAATEAKNLAKSLEMLALQKQQDGAAHAVPGAQVQIQNVEAQRAQQPQRTTSPAPQGPAKPSVLLKPSLLAHSPSRLSRMTPRASLQDDNGAEESGQGKGLQFKPHDVHQGHGSTRLTVSQATTPQGSNSPVNTSVRHTHDVGGDGNSDMSEKSQVMYEAPFWDNQKGMQAGSAMQQVQQQVNRVDSLASARRGVSDHSEPEAASKAQRRSNSFQHSGSFTPSGYDSIIQQPPLTPTRGKPTTESLQQSDLEPLSAPGAAVHAEGEAFEPSGSQQDWEPEDGDDIAAAVAQYTGSKHKSLPVQDRDQHPFEAQQAQHAQQQQPQQPRSKPQLAVQHRDNFKKSSSFHHRRGEQADRPTAESSYAEQQARMNAEFEAAMFADATAENGDTAGGHNTAGQYATPQEQMEAELEAALAGEDGGSADRALPGSQWESLESELDAAGAQGVAHAHAMSDCLRVQTYSCRICSPVFAVLNVPKLNKSALKQFGREACSQ